MNRGIMLKALREVWMITLMFGVGLMIVEALLAFVLPKLQEQFGGMIAQMKFFQTIMKALLGTDIGDGLGPQGIQAIAWVHPVVLALLWAHSIVICTRVPAGEVDRGTADVLFSLPVSRWRMYVSECLVWLGTMVALLVMALIGNRIGSLAAPPQFRLEWRGLAMVLANMYCLGLAVGGMAFLTSALSNRRGKAMAAVFVIVLASFLLNFLGQFWEPAQKVAFLGVLNYYRPIEVLRLEAVPIKDVLVLVLFGGAMWALGGVVMARRDITTV